MSDINSDLVAQEVDDEVRRERLNLLWKTYGKYIIGAAVGVVLVVAGREAYRWRVESIEGAQSVAFQDALDAASEEGADAVAVWRDAVPTLDASGYRALAQLRLAGAAFDAGNADEALTTYETIAADTSVDALIRDLATLKGAMIVASVNGDLDTAKGQLSTIAIKGKAWYFSAQEQLALIDLQQGDMAGALTKFTLLADDAETPATIQARATQFRNFIEAKQFAVEASSTSLPAETETNSSSETVGEGQ